MFHLLLSALNEEGNVRLLAFFSNKDRLYDGSGGEGMHSDVKNVGC